MVRPYTIKGHKRKRREENYDKEEVEQLLEEETAATATQDENKAEEITHELPGIPLVPFKSNNKTGVTFILERACLEVAKVGKVINSISSLVMSTPALLIHFAYLFIKTTPLPF